VRLFASYRELSRELREHDFWIHLWGLIWITIAAPCSSIFNPRFARIFASVAKMYHLGGDILHVLALQLIALIYRKTVTRIKPFSVIPTRFSALQQYIITIKVINSRDMLFLIRAPPRRPFFILECYKRGKLLASHVTLRFIAVILHLRVWRTIIRMK